ncbi:MAG: hypothetical protein ACFCBU_10280, partial [Cyanophyceae cyanobacterium]
MLETFQTSSYKWNGSVRLDAPSNNLPICYKPLGICRGAAPTTPPKGQRPSGLLGVDYSADGDRPQSLIFQVLASQGVIATPFN